MPYRWPRRRIRARPHHIIQRRAYLLLRFHAHPGGRSPNHVRLRHSSNPLACLSISSAFNLEIYCSISGPRNRPLGTHSPGPGDNIYKLEPRESSSCPSLRKSPKTRSDRVLPLLFERTLRWNDSETHKNKKNLQTNHQNKLPAELKLKMNLNRRGRKERKTPLKHIVDRFIAYSV